LRDRGKSLSLDIFVMNIMLLCFKERKKGEENKKSAKKSVSIRKLGRKKGVISSLCADSRHQRKKSSGHLEKEEKGGKKEDRDQRPAR